MRFFTSISFLVFSVTALAQGNTGIFLHTADFGKPEKTGSTTYDSSMQVYSMRGSIGRGRGEFHYAYTRLKGDFMLTADFEFFGPGVDPQRKVGWMIRHPAGGDTAQVSAVLQGDGLTTLQRRVPGDDHTPATDEVITATKSHYQTLRLERTGNKVSMYASHPGEPLQLIGSYELQGIGDEVFAGLFIGGRGEGARVWNVRIDKPVADSYDAYRDGFLGSRLEIMNVSDGFRKVIHESSGRFEAPNWMPDGRRLLFNGDGALWTIPLTGGIPEKLNTGSAISNNNDHVISFDGEMLAISSHREGLPGGGSTIYVLPLQGGEPRLVTEKTPSYLHGWNPNGRELVYVARRDSERYDVYKIPIDGGTEERLTSNRHAHVDGPEYSPDGRYIYYNDSRSGTMQLWRMKPDGSAKEQLTYDQYNNWFPHISPDGKWIAFLSFSCDVRPADHPSYKRVMLRLMPAGGGAPRVIAHLYGGQGTINVPSWSPDSQFIAFVSNSEKKDTVDRQ